MVGIVPANTALGAVFLIIHSNISSTIKRKSQFKGTVRRKIRGRFVGGDALWRGRFEEGTLCGGDVLKRGRFEGESFMGDGLWRGHYVEGRFVEAP